MKVTVKKLPKSEVEMRIEVDADKIVKYRAKVIHELGREVKIDGFRKGHVPETVLIQRLGETTIMSEVIETAVRESFGEAVKQEDIYILATPKIAIDQHEPLIYTAIAPVMPEVTVPLLSEISIPPKIEAVITEEEIEEAKKRLAERFMELKKVEREAIVGDLVEVDFEGFDKDRVSLEGAMSKHHPVVIGSNSLIPGFEDALVGLKAGDQKSFDLNFPKDYHKQSYQNKPVKFEVKVHDVFERVIPPFDDNFAEKATGKKQTAKEFEEEIVKSLKARREEEDGHLREEGFLDNLAEKSSMEIPEILIEQEIDEMVENFKGQLSKMRMTWEKHLENLKTTEEEFRNTVREKAENRVKKRLSFSKLLDNEQIAVEDQEIEVAAQKAISNYPHDQRDQARDYYKKGKNGWKELKQQIKVEKMFNQIFA